MKGVTTGTNNNLIAGFSSFKGIKYFQWYKSHANAFNLTNI